MILGLVCGCLVKSLNVLLSLNAVLGFTKLCVTPCLVCENMEGQ